jgi:hypothetical protein
MQCLIGIAMLVQVDDRDLRALTGHCDGGRAADPTVAAGNERNAVFELAHPRIFGLAAAASRARGRADGSAVVRVAGECS